MGLGEFRWIETLKPLLNKYNNTVHRTISLSPSDARKPSNKLIVWHNLWSGAKRTRKYTELKVGDKVRVMMRKDPHTRSTGYHPKWTDKTYEVKFINKDNEYMLDYEKNDHSKDMK